MWKNYPQPSRRQAMKDMEIMQQAIKNPNPCLNKDTTRWKEGERKLYKVKDGRKIYETLQRKKDNIKLSKAIFRIKTENRKGRSIEVGPGWRQGPSGLIIDCYETQKFGAKEFGALHGREYKMKKEFKLRKLMDEELARHIAMYKSEYSVKCLQEDYNRKRNLVSKTPRVDPTAIHLDLYGPNARKKNTVVRGLVKIEPKELDLPEWDSSPTKLQESKKSVYAHALALQKLNITTTPYTNTMDCSKFSPPYRVRVNKLENTKNMNKARSRPKSASAVKSNVSKNLTEISYVSTGISKKMILPDKEFNQPYPTINISDEELIYPRKCNLKIEQYRPHSANTYMPTSKGKESLKHRILHGREQNGFVSNEIEIEDQRYGHSLEESEFFPENALDSSLVGDDFVFKTDQNMLSYIHEDDILASKFIDVDHGSDQDSETKEFLCNTNVRRSYIGSCEVPVFFNDEFQDDQQFRIKSSDDYDYIKVDVFDVGFDVVSVDSEVIKTSAGLFLEGTSDVALGTSLDECIEFVSFGTLADLVKQMPDLHEWLTSHTQQIYFSEETENIYKGFKLTNSIVDILQAENVSSSNIVSKILNAISMMFSIRINKKADSDENSPVFVY